MFYSFISAFNKNESNLKKSKIKVKFNKLNKSLKLRHDKYRRLFLTKTFFLANRIRIKKVAHSSHSKAS